jgi:hypothetical protein
MPLGLQLGLVWEILTMRCSGVRGSEEAGGEEPERAGRGAAEPEDE